MGDARLVTKEIMPKSRIITTMGMRLVLFVLVSMVYVFVSGYKKRQTQRCMCLPLAWRRQPFKASEPLTISIISFVMEAWRALL